ncbi:MAG: hypothetical protein KJZ74_00835 [Gemmatimonadales bacterium]|nr:hypothetical protein [Gemmatimonadales bacterium]
MFRPIVRFALVLAVAAPALSAQQAKAPMDAHQHGAVKLDAEMADHFKGIPLTEEQVKQVMATKTRHHDAMDALKKGAKDQDDPALKAALKQHMDAEHAEFKAMLTPEQYRKFEENMAAHHAAEAKGEAKHRMDHDMGGMKHDAKEKAEKAKPAAGTKKP